MWQKRIKHACLLNWGLQRRLQRSTLNTLKCFLLSSLSFGVLPFSSPLLFPSLPSHPSLFFFNHSLSLSEWAALGLLGLVEVYQKHVWRVGGGWWEVLHQAASPSQWWRKALSEFTDINLLAFYRIFFPPECINRKKLLTLNQAVYIARAWKTGWFSQHSAAFRHCCCDSPASPSMCLSLTPVCVLDFIYHRTRGLTLGHLWPSNPTWSKTDILNDASSKKKHSRRSHPNEVSKWQKQRWEITPFEKAVKHMFTLPPCGNVLLWLA